MPAARMRLRTASAAARDSHTTPAAAVVTPECSARTGRATPRVPTATAAAGTELPNPRSTGHARRVASAPSARQAQRASSTGSPTGSRSWTAAIWIAASRSHSASDTGVIVASRTASTATAKRASPAVATQSEVNVAAMAWAATVITATARNANSAPGGLRSARSGRLGTTKSAVPESATAASAVFGWDTAGLITRTAAAPAFGARPPLAAASGARATSASRLDPSGRRACGMRSVTSAA